LFKRARERENLGDPGVLRWIFRKWDARGMDWNELAQNRERWWALVTAVMNLGVP